MRASRDANDGDESCSCLSLLLCVGAIAGGLTAGGPDLSLMSFSDEPLARKFVWYALITDDVEGARRFHGEPFGWTFEETTGPRGDHRVLLLDDGSGVTR